MTDGNTPEVRAQDVSAYVQQFGTDTVAGIVLVDSPVSAGPAEAKLHPAMTEALLGAIATTPAHRAGFRRAWCVRSSRSRTLTSTWRKEMAARHYRAFIALWHECDPALRPLVAQAVRELEQL